jgi:hypothetical protein
MSFHNTKAFPAAFGVNHFYMYRNNFSQKTRPHTAKEVNYGVKRSVIEQFYQMRQFIYPGGIVNGQNLGDSIEVLHNWTKLFLGEKGKVCLREREAEVQDRRGRKDDISQRTETDDENLVHLEK